MSAILYYNDSFLREWTTTIVERKEQDEQYFVRLAETAFYPHGGGQPCDTGVINDIAVLDVVKEEEVIWHQVERLPIEDQADCQLNWERRFDHMQHHTGQHLLSATALQLFDAPTLSFHLGQDMVTIDIDRSSFSDAEMTTLEQAVNQRIYNNLAIKSYFVNAEQLAQLPIVKMPKVTEHIRIVEIEGVEYNACGGTHVAQTGQISIIKLFKAEKQKGSIRLYFKCGARALQDYNNSLDILNTLAVKFNTGRKDILERFGKWEEDQQQLKTELEQLRKANDIHEAKQLSSQIQNQQLTHMFEHKTLPDLQRIAANLMAEQPLIVLLATSSEYKVFLAQNGHPQLECGAFFKEHLSTFNGKGGGSDLSAQATFTSEADLIAFYTFAEQQLGIMH
ncbi:DHHA1 domain-containing protein [Paenibacillus sp. PK4536]|uniref:alanyl-tRNA editing protein n=1 Tax=Paenibacillus sp. PK4536 TaxID=3024576 RepID=UPI00235867D2|nr:DHHA1 domain-containing protein [Paenibacillus sp. PK4536]WIM38306.1 DHHA1 domain-containing protein [Paenibacillus sp. PK4536]